MGSPGRLDRELWLTLREIHDSGRLRLRGGKSGCDAAIRGGGDEDRICEGHGQDGW